MNDHSQPDRWLDEELARYSNVEPRPGLEHRVLAHVRDSVRAEAAPRRKFWLRWAIVAPALAVLLFIVDSNLPRRSRPEHLLGGPRKPPSLAWEQQHQPLSPAPQRKSAAMPRKLPLLTRENTRRPLPRLAVFPSPEPLTPQEKLLLAALHDAPEVVAKLGVPPGPLQPPAPIEIQPLKITPLNEPDVPGGFK